MGPTEVQIVPSEPRHLEAVVALSLRAWERVFPRMADEIPAYVYANFYPDGWQARQRQDVETLCLHDEATQVWVATVADTVVGFVGLREHQRDNMGEIYILAVDPAQQRQGIGRSLLEFAFDRFKRRGLGMVIVETGGDSGHAPSRAAYQSAGFERYPVARYFRRLD